MISAITLGELEHGWRAGLGDRETAAEPFLALIPVLPFDARGGWLRRRDGPSATAEARDL